MSKRIGLRTMGSIGAKKAVVCPSGEQITNGGFETGDLTGWTIGPVPSPWYPEVSSAYPRTGSYACELTYIEWIEQDLATPVLAECLTDSSVFGFYARHTTSDQQTPYEFANLQPYVEAGKTIKSIKIERLTSDQEVWIDDVTCNV